MRCVPRKRERWGLFRTKILLVCLALASTHCEDPPSPQGAFILGIRTVLPTDPNPTLSGWSFAPNWQV